MAKKKKRPSDVNLLARQIVEEAIGESLATGEPIPKPAEPKPVKEKNPAAVELGRLGGLKGGRARDAILTQEQKREIAQRAAKARWSKNGK